MFETDYFTRSGATELKRKIEVFHEKRGLFPDVRVIQQQHAGKDERPIYVIRSNLEFDDKGYPFVRKTS